MKIDAYLLRSLMDSDSVRKTCYSWYLKILNRFGGTLPTGHVEYCHRCVDWKIPIHTREMLEALSDLMPRSQRKSSMEGKRWGLGPGSC